MLEEEMQYPVEIDQIHRAIVTYRTCVSRFYCIIVSTCSPMKRAQKPMVRIGITHSSSELIPPVFLFLILQPTHFEQFKLIPTLRS